MVGLFRSRRGEEESHTILLNLFCSFLAPTDDNKNRVSRNETGEQLDERGCRF